MKIKLDPGAFMPEYAHEQDAGMQMAMREVLEYFSKFEL